MYGIVKIFLFVVNRFLSDLFKDYKKRKKIRGNLCRLSSAVNLMLKLPVISTKTFRVYIFLAFYRECFHYGDIPLDGQTGRLKIILTAG